MTPRLATAAVLLLVAATACSGSSSNDTVANPPSSAPAATATTSTAAADSGAVLTIKGFHYSALQVAPGTTITVKNQDDADHTVTSDTKGVFSVDDISKDSPKTFTAPTKPGTYTYFCEYHASMHGSITVT